MAKSALEGPPFLIIISEKRKSKLRKMYLAMLLLWIIHAVIRYSVNDPIQIFSHMIFVILYLPAITILLDNSLIITGDHDQWRLLRIKNLIWKNIIISDFDCDQLKIEIRIVSAKKNSVSLVLLNNPTNNMSIKVPNNQIQDFIDECEIVNLEVLIRKRGSSNSIN